MQFSPILNVFFDQRFVKAHDVPRRGFAASVIGMKTIAATLAIAIAASLGLESIALAQEYVPPPNIGIPGRRRAAGTRAPGACVSGEIPLTALQPENSYAVTLGNPTWFWYKPETTAATAEFALLDRSGNSVYEATVTLPAEAQIVSLSLPETIELQPDSDYHWYFSIVCNPDDRSQDLYTEGWVRRVSPPANLASLPNLAPLNRAALLGESGFWYDAIAIIAAEQRAAMPAADQGWRSLLESVDLGDVADVPLSETDLSIVTQTPSP